MARGVKFGSKHKLTLHQQQEAKRRRDAGENLSEIGRLFGVNYRTIGRL
jgi:Helix-turn-helix domain